MKKDMSRRVFLERLGACTLGGAALSRLSDQRVNAQTDAHQASAAWTKPPQTSNPNVLIILVDQMRLPCWLSSAALNTFNQTYMPNIVGRIRNNSYAFQQYFAAATACVPSRSTLMTGLYAAQTAMFDTNHGAPTLSPAFATWAAAMASLNPAYQANVWWFGKWHLSDSLGGPSPLTPYGLNTGTYPGGLSTNSYTGQPYYIASPNGAPNQGLNGGVTQAKGPYKGQIMASDQMIAGDFINWLQGQSPFTARPASSWCTTVSLINPHDIAEAPAWFGSSLPPASLPGESIFFPSDFPNQAPAAPAPPPLLTATPSPWNWENLGSPSGAQHVANKPSHQYSFLGQLNGRYGKVTDWTTFLNEYYWLHYFVDQQVGNILNALQNSGYASNTIVIFASDHGEYAGSHGLHDKSGAVYDETLHVPLYIQFPGQTGCIAMNQMCSSVDFFGLMCDLATGGGGLWRTAYPDLRGRQSLWDFLQTNCSETRTVAVGPAQPAVAIPYILHTVDESTASEYCPPGPALPPDNSHIVCLRTKYNAASASPGAKLAVYSHWPGNAVCWDGVTPQEFEFYDYNPQTTNNHNEMGNDYSPSNSTAASYLNALGNWGPTPTGLNGTGLIGSELNPPLVGLGTDGNPLSQAQAAAQQQHYAYVDPCNG